MALLPSWVSFRLSSDADFARLLPRPSWPATGGWQPEDSEKEVGLLKRARLAVIESVWGHAGASVALWLWQARLAADVCAYAYVSSHPARRVVDAGAGRGGLALCHGLAGGGANPEDVAFITAQVKAFLA